MSAKSRRAHNRRQRLNARAVRLGKRPVDRRQRQLQRPRSHHPSAPSYVKDARQVSRCWRDNSTFNSHIGWDALVAEMKARKAAQAVAS